ncbi:MAG TPA: SDR family oxidoreductase [Trueperaceae bacterium]
MTARESPAQWGGRPAAGSGARTALITGASKGLGFALARYLASRHYRLVIDARSERELSSAAAELAEVTTVTAVTGDVRDEAHRAALVEAVGDELDLLVNNASDLGVTPLPPLVQYDLERFRQVFEANVFAPLALVQATLPALFNGHGLVVNLSSDAARGGYPGWGAYGASKAALDLVGLTLANELQGVTVVNVDPGDMRTDMHQAAFPGEDIGDRKLPQETLPFWAGLFEQTTNSLNGKRLEAQAEVWESA